MAVSANIYELVSQEINSRDREWESAFFHTLPTAKLKILNDAPVAGPDGWPYLLVQIDEAGTEPASKVLQWLSDKGIGLVLNPQKEDPDFIFTYGMIWNFRERGHFFSTAEKIDLTQFDYQEGQKVLAGPPAESYLPPYARYVLKSFFRDNGVKDMKVLLLSKDQENYDLCFSLEAFGSPNEKEHRGILEALSWFLPSHYSLVIVSEKGLPAFHSL